MSRSLLPPSASAIERAVEQATERIGEVPVAVRDGSRPDTCPAELLPWLAWALSVDHWDRRWPESVQRQVIRESLQVHRRKGTRGALMRALGAMDVRIDLDEWFETGGVPHTFALTARANTALVPGGEAILDAKFYDTLRRTVDTVKPIRSHYDLRVGAQYSSGVAVATGLFGGSYLRDRAITEVRPILRRTSLALAATTRSTSIVRLTMEVL